jgi:hypothetical protein
VRAPSEYYIKYLVLAGTSDTRVGKLLDQMGHPRPGHAYTKRLRDSLTPPRPFRIGGGRSSRQTTKWLTRHKLYPLFVRDAHMDEATDILGQHDLRLVLETFLLAGVGVDEIIDTVVQRFGRELPEQTIRYYGHFFWNRSLLTPQEWGDWLKDYRYGPQLKGVYDEGPQMAKWRLGFNNRMDANDMLKVVRDESFHRFMQTHTMANDVGTAKVAATWAGTFFEAHKNLASGDTQLAEVISRFEALVLHRGGDKIVPLDQLAGANHTGRALPGQAPTIIDVDNRSVAMDQELEEELTEVPDD